MSELRCEMSEQAQGLVLRISGQFGAAESPEFDRHAAMVADRRARRVVLDMSGLSFITSAGLGAIMKLQNRLRGSGTSFVLAAMQPRIAEVLRRAALDQMFTIADSVDAALA